MSKPTNIDINITNIRGTLTKEQIDILKKKRELIQNMFDVFIKHVCFKNTSGEIMRNFKQEMGELYNFNFCKEKSSDNYSLQEVKTLIEYVHNIKHNISIYSTLQNNNIYNLFIVYCLVMLIKKIFNFIRQNPKLGVELKFKEIMNKTDDLNYIYNTLEATVTSENIYNVLKSFSKNKLSAEISMNIRSQLNDKKKSINELSKALFKKMNIDKTDKTKYASNVLEIRNKLDSKLHNIYDESNNMKEGAIKCVEYLLDNISELIDAIEKSNQSFTITQIFETIEKALEYTENNDKQRLLMNNSLKSFENFSNGFLIGKIVFESTKSINLIPTKKIIIIDKIYEQLSTNIDLIINEIDLSGNNLKEPVNSTNVSDTIINNNLDLIIKQAKLFTLAEENSKIQPVIEEIITSILSLFDVYKSYENDDCIVYSIFNQEKMQEILDKMLAGGRNNRFINISCGYLKRMSALPVRVSFSGGAIEDDHSFVNIQKILNDKLDFQLKCTFVNKSKCQFCEQWYAERLMFKKIASEMIKKDNILEILELMNESIDLLPIAILDKEDFHKFHIAIQEYKKTKQMKSF
jgi:hypothetical protein